MKRYKINNKKIFIDTGDNKSNMFDAVSKYPNYRLFLKLIELLNKKGFVITPNPYYEKNYNSISKNHRIGYKHDMVILLDIYPNSIEIAFENKKNYDSKLNFITPTYHEEYKKLTYLENLRIKKSILDIKKFLKGFTDDTEKDDFVNFIINFSKNNSHFFGKVNSFNEYELIPCKGKDKNGKYLITGETKYYYDDDKLNKGKVYPYSSDSCMVLNSDGSYKQIQTNKLFDYDNTPKKRVLENDELLHKLNEVLKDYEGKQDYIRCFKLKKYIDKLTNKQKKYYVYSLKWGKYWGFNNSGYTSEKKNAGIYYEDFVKTRLNYYNDGKINKLIEIC